MSNGVRLGQRGGDFIPAQEGGFGGSFKVNPPLPHNGKLVSPTAREKLTFPRIIYKRSRLHKLAVNLVRATERSGSSASVMESGRKHFVAESMYKCLQTHFEVLKLCISKSTNK